METPGTVLPGQWLGNSQKNKVWQWAGHFHHSSDLPQVFSEKQHYYKPKQIIVLTEQQQDPNLQSYIHKGTFMAYMSPQNKLLWTEQAHNDVFKNICGGESKHLKALTGEE